MSSRLTLGDIDIELVRKNIKNVHLSVHPPAGRVRIAAPSHMKLDTIRVFAISKLNWIKKQQKKLREQERETPRDYLNRESHYVWGKRYLMQVVDVDTAPAIVLKHSRMHLHLRPGTSPQKKHEILEQWYREQVKNVASELITHWEALMGVAVERVFVQHMKTRWGSCNHARRSIRLNTELAKKPIDCLEYIVVHEMGHILEPTHSARFISLMDRFMPDWERRRDKLNRLPIRHEDWDY